MATRIVKGQGFTWYNITDFSSDEIRFLKKNFKFHPLDLKDCGETQRSKIDIYKNYIFIIFQFPQLDKTTGKVTVSQVYVFIGRDFLVTITRDRIKYLNNFFYKTVNNSAFRDEALNGGAGYLTYRLLDTLLRNSWLVHGYLDQRISRAEKLIDEGESKKSVFKISSLRRLILQLKSIIDPQRVVTNTMSRLDVPFLNKDLLVYFDDLDDFTEKNWYLLDSYKERILSLQEINESLIYYRTNQVMKVLTIFSVSILPLTLFSGIYGMNIELPFDENPHLVWLMFFFMSGIIAGILVILKRKDLI